MPRLDSTIKIGPFTFTECFYDVDGDVAYFSIGSPQEAITLESPEGHLLRLNPDTDELVGITFLHMKKRLDSGHLSITFPECVLPARSKKPAAVRTPVVIPPRTLAAYCL